MHEQAGKRHPGRVFEMSPYGKVSQAAIAATSLLAERYSAAGGERLNSAQIAAQRKLSQAMVAKVLTILSQTGIVTGAPGPGGGYTLARDPDTISLYEVVAPFERLERTVVCPFGEGWCGTGPQCPLHDKLLQFQTQVTTLLQQTKLSSFQTHPTADQSSTTKQRSRTKTPTRSTPAPRRTK